MFACHHVLGAWSVFVCREVKREEGGKRREEEERGGKRERREEEGGRRRKRKVKGVEHGTTTVLDEW